MSLQWGSYFNLNKVMSRIWEMLEEPIRPAAICNQLMENYDVDRGRCEEEVLAALIKLHAKGLVVAQ